jgi:hypothetical protein
MFDVDRFRGFSLGREQKSPFPLLILVSADNAVQSAIPARDEAAYPLSMVQPKDLGVIGESACITDTLCI